MNLKASLRIKYGVTDEELHQIQVIHGDIENIYPQTILTLVLLMRTKIILEKLNDLEKRRYGG